MRARHTSHPLANYPVFASAFVSNDRLVLGGGGGSTKSGIKNRLRLYEIHADNDIRLLDEFELKAGEDAPMSMACVSATKSIVCGINGSEEQIKAGENPNCRVFSTTDDKLALTKAKGTLSSRDVETVYQKVAAISPDSRLAVAAGEHEFSILSLPNLDDIVPPITLTESEIYDASFSPSSVLVATTKKIFVYQLPKGGTKLLSLPKEIEVPPLPGVIGTCTFRAAQFNPQDPKSAYAVVNSSPPRKGKSNAFRSFICKYNTDTWQVEKIRKIGDKRATCMDVSEDGKLIAFGSSELAVGILDAQSLAPLLTVLKAHELPTTTLRFNPNATLLVSGSADNTIRVIAVPKFGGTSWTTTLFILTLIIVLLAILFQYLQNSNLL